MLKNLRLLGRYTLLMLIAMAAGVAVITLSQLPPWMARACGVVGAGWSALRYVMWKSERTTGR